MNGQDTAKYITEKRYNNLVVGRVVGATVFFDATNAVVRALSKDSKLRVSYAASGWYGKFKAVSADFDTDAARASHRNI